MKKKKADKIITDPTGAYTGKPKGIFKDDKPTQDVDDL